MEFNTRAKSRVTAASTERLLNAFERKTGALVIRTI